MTKRWGVQDYILGALSETVPTTERSIRVSVPEQYHKQFEPALAALVEAGFVMQKGKRFVRVSKSRT